MANPRQRQKIKTGRIVTRRTNKKYARKLGRRGNEVIQGEWDKTKTLHENYAQMGLVSNINKQGLLAISTKNASGSYATLEAYDSGDDVDETIPGDAERPNLDPTVFIKETKADVVSDDQVQFGKIKRDENGNVIGIVLGDEEPEQESTEPTSDNITEVKPKSKVVEGMLFFAQSVLEPNSYNQRLRTCRRKVPQWRWCPLSVKSALLKSCSGSMELITRYPNVAFRILTILTSIKKAMARDIKLNKYQHTANQIRRKFEKYCAFMGIASPSDISF
jgi:nucleolar protein 16